MNDVFAKVDLTGAGPGDTRQCPGSEPVLGLPCGLCRVSREIPIVRMYFYVFREPVKKIKVENSTLGLTPSYGKKCGNFSRFFYRGVSTQKSKKDMV